MKSNLLRGIIIISILATTLLVAACSNEPIPTPYVAEEFIICNASHNQAFPSISGDIVVWTDYRIDDDGVNDFGDIYGYNLSDGREFPICTEENYQGSPDIDGAIVIWKDGRNDYSDVSNSDIYGYNLSTGSEFVICNESHDQGTPSISGDTVVWMDDRGDIDDVSYIYGCNLSSGEVVPISTYQSLKMFPSIYNDMVTWLDFRTMDLATIRQQPQPVWNTEIYCFNLSSDLEFAVTDDETMQDLPGADIYGDIVVWGECDEGLCSIYSYDLMKQTKSTLSTSHDSMHVPVIYGDIIVWTDFRNGNGDIYGYNLKTGEEFAICTAPGNQMNPAIYGNIVVWEDDREELDNRYDIYGARLTFENP